MYARGGVIVVNLDPSIRREQAQKRPCLVVQTAMLSRAQILAMCEESLTRRGLPFLVPIPKGEGGLIKDSHVLAHQIRIVDKSRILEKLGSLKAKTMREVDAALKFTLELDQD